MRGRSSISSAPGRASSLELGGDVLDLVGDVVHARPSLGQELPDRRLLAERGEQLDPAAAEAHGCRLDALVGHGRAVLELGAEEPLVGRDRLVKIVDGDAEVVDALRGHTRRSYRPPASRRAG